MRIIPSNRFGSDFEKLVKKNRKYLESVGKALKMLAVDMDHPSLRLHKLNGKDTYSISVDMKIRILISIEKEAIYLLRIGTHDDIY